MSRMRAAAMAALALIWASEVAATVEVRVASVYFPPYVLAKDEPGGLLEQLLGTMNQAQSEYRFVPRPTSLPRRFADLREGRLDLAVFENPDWGWQGIAATRLNMGLEDAEVYVARRLANRDQDFFDRLQGKSLALFKGYHYGFNGFVSDSQVLRRDYQAQFAYSHDSILSMVRLGRADIGLLTRSWLRRRQQLEPVLAQELLVSERVDQTYRHYMLLRPQAPIAAQRLEALLAELHHSGTLARIFEPYGIRVWRPSTDR